jgi:glutamyl-tRNA reductase
VVESLVVATCHRVELYVVTRDLAGTEHALRQSVIDAIGADAVTSTYQYTGARAIEHLCKVASGLDSMIIGEAEIAGQIRRAAAAGRQAGTLGVFLERVVAGALRASGRARSETRIAQGALSAATAAVSIVEHALGPLDDRTVLVIGAGEAGQQALARFARRRTRRVIVASRSLYHARDAAARSGAEVADIHQLAPILSQVDAVVAATRGGAYVVGVATLVARAGRPLLAVDLSMPRALDPAIAALPGVTLRTVDDLGEVVRESVARRRREIPKVERIAYDEAQRAYAQFLRRSAVA